MLAMPPRIVLESHRYEQGLHSVLKRALPAQHWRHQLQAMPAWQFFQLARQECMPVLRTGREPQRRLHGVHAV